MARLWSGHPVPGGRAKNKARTEDEQWRKQIKPLALSCLKLNFDAGFDPVMRGATGREWNHHEFT
jgi:hypothetical protein